MTDDLDGIATFLAVAEAKGFRAAAERLRVTGSAVSQTIRRLEERLGVALVHRNTRSVHLTEAGDQLYASVRPAMEEVRSAVAAVGELSQKPRGMIRLHISGSADSFLKGPLLASFLAAHPEIQLELFVSDLPADIVAQGYDAGVRLGEVIDRDMIAVPVTDEVRLLVAGSPAYFSQHAKPMHPRDLARHVCIAWSAAQESAPCRWEFTEGDSDFVVAISTRVRTNDPQLNIRLACAGLGLVMEGEERLRNDIASGALEPVLEDFCPPFPGFYLYYTDRRRTSRQLRALIDFVRQARSKH
jgi:DNA-binding transcriptional LysR family regulator